MNPKSTRSSRAISCVLLALSATVLLNLPRPASAQWRAVDAQNAFSGYNNAFLYLEPDGYSKVFVTEQGGTTHEGFWTQAEEIEAAEDAYNENPTSANKNEVQALCDGFVNYVHPATNDMWTSDNYNDDLDVAIIAFARAYLITGTTRWLTDAQNNYSAVWNRAQEALTSQCTVNGDCNAGLCQNVALGCYENSSVNWTFAIAAAILNQIDPNGTGYNSQGNGVYTWAKANLYDSSTGQIYDAMGGVTGQYTYNYGFAMIAGSYHNANVMIPNISTYVFNNLTNYSGTSDGYNIMPNYGQGDLNNSGFNGILMRGVGIANANGFIPSAVLLAAQANINQAWSERNCCTTLVWNDWVAPTPSTGTYSWDDSAALAGLLDLPPTAN
jgi:hypothetical protein